MPTWAELKTKSDIVNRELELTMMALKANKTTERAALIEKLKRLGKEADSIDKIVLHYMKARKT